MNKVNIMLICGSISYAGSQRQMVELARYLDKRKFNVVMCSLSSDVQLKSELDGAGIPVEIIGKRFRYFIPIILRVKKLLEKHKIRIIYSFLFEANLVARIAGWLARTPIVICSERSSNYEMKDYEVIVEKLTERLYDLTIANSQTGRDFLMKNKRVPKDKIKVVYNGIDPQRFEVSNNNDTKGQLNIPKNSLVIGIIARFKPAKNHKMFFQVAKEIISKYPNVYFICVGDTAPMQENYYKKMIEFLRDLRIEKRIMLTGKRLDIPNILNIMDISVLTSSWEGLPNTLIESMLMGIPVVVTDVGDNLLIVENEVNGFVVPVNDVDKMAEKISILLEDENLRKEIGNRNKEKAISLFSIEKMVKNTEDIFLELLEKKRKVKV